MKMISVVAALLTMAACVGCETNPPSTSVMQQGESAPPPPQPAAASSNPPPAAAPAAQPAAVPNPAGQGAAASAPVAAAAGGPATAPAETADQQLAPAEADPAHQEKAQVGVGKRGRDYEPGMITTPIAAYFRTGDRIAFEVQIPNAMKLYKADHNNKGPKTHEEFWNIIIKENGVQLPELPAGDKYIYDTKTEELMVQHPKEK